MQLAVSFFFVCFLSAFGITLGIQIARGLAQCAARFIAEFSSAPQRERNPVKQGGRASWMLKQLR